MGQTEQSLKRAGLDFWEFLDFHYYDDFTQFLNLNNNPARLYLITKFGKTNYINHSFKKDDYFLFGRETKGLPDTIHKKYPQDNQALYIPMPGISRSINLSNSVAIIIYEGLRQLKI